MLNGTERKQFIPQGALQKEQRRGVRLAHLLLIRGF